jgi:DNA-binding beta-propeller fold protein YncE
VIDTQTKQVVGSPIPVGSSPFGIAIIPDQPPLASFIDPRARPGIPVAFNASASSDPDGTIARFDWVFGDGQTAPGGGPTPSHTYKRPGTYKATLTLTDNEGCSTALVFTGQTAYCNGQASAAQTQTIKVAYPGVPVKCPKRAKPKGCRFKLQALSKKRKGKVESATAKVKAKAGKSLVVSLKPKKKFRSKLAAATKILVKETVTISGSSRIVFRKLKVVQ